jgi:hypothetical protein
MRVKKKEEKEVEEALGEGSYRVAVYECGNVVYIGTVSSA